MVSVTTDPGPAGQPALTKHSRRRPDIQAMRAIAALLVVVFHLWPNWLTGGYIGVDVFFVISGFLITSQLTRETKAGASVRLAEFWARRARRLLPGAFLVLTFTASATWLLVPEAYFGRFFRGIAASALYVENWSLAHDAVDYLAQETAPTPTQHYWTLAAEEQFYIVWPLLFVLALWMSRYLRLNRAHAITATLTVATALSFAYSLYYTSTNPERAFFVTPTRAWEFGAGALLALVPLHRIAWLNGMRGAVLAWSGLGIVLASGFWFDGATSMPGWPALVVVLGATAFIAGGQSVAPITPGHLLDLRPVQYAGDISYAVYLWHWPLIVLMPYATGHPNGTRSLVGILLLTFILAGLSTRFVENPIRYTKAPQLRKPSVTLALGVGTAAVMGAACMQVAYAEETRARQDQVVAENFAESPPRCAGAASIDPVETCRNPQLDRILVPSLEAASKDRPKVEAANCASREPDEAIVPCRGGDWDDPTVPKVAIIGDSHARMWATALQRLADDGVLAWEGYFQSGCLWGTDPPHRTIYGPQCESFKKRMIPILEQNSRRFDFVMTTGRVSKLEGTLDDRAAGLAEAWATVTTRGVPVVALSDVPEIGDATACLVKHDRNSMQLCDRSASGVLTRPDPFMRAVELDKNSYAIDMHPYYCLQDRCPVVIGGVVVYADSNHLTATYVSTLAPILKRELAKLDLL